MISAQDIASNFEDRDHARGKLYQSEGRVREIKVDPKGNRLSALVQGSQKAPYRVDIEILSRKGLTRVESYCSCPVGYMCKHGVAALYEMIAQATRQQDKIGKNKKGQDALSWSVRSWLDLIDKTEQTSGEDERQERLIYLLTPAQENDVKLKIGAATQTLLRSGIWSHPRPLAPYHILTLKQQRGHFLTPHDEAVFTLLTHDRITSSGSTAFWNLPKDSDLADLILSRVVMTERAFLLDGDMLSEAPLHLGPALAAVMGWALQADETQTPTLLPQTPSVRLWDIGQPWYINPLSHQVGPLLCQESKDLVRRFLAAPPVREKEAKLIRQHIEKKNLSLPAPYKIQEAGGPSSVLPTPVLSLTPKSKDGPPIAQLSFSYDGDMIAANSSSPHYASIDGDTILLRRRNKKAEQTWIDLLEEHRLKLVSSDRDDGKLNAPDEEAAPWFWLDFHYMARPVLEEAGVEIKECGTNLSTVIAPDTQDIEAAMTQSGDWWFSLDLGIMVDGQRIPLLPILVSLLKEVRNEEDIDKLLEGGMCYAPLPDGRRVALPAERVRTILKTLVELFDDKALDEEGRLRVSVDLTAAFLKLEAITKKRWIGHSQLRTLVEKLSDFSGIKKVALPKGLKATLRPYQQDGYNWLHFLGEYGLSGILADDMGLGKTVQALAYLQSLKEKKKLEGPCLIVMPTSLVANWQAEIARFTPDMKVMILHGKDRKALHKHIQQSDIVLTTYPLLPRDADLLAKEKWDIIILDEAQAIKNPSAKMTQAACTLQARQRLCLTGTPVENHLGEAWSLFTFLMPGLLGHHKSFTKHYRTPIEKGLDTERKELFARRLRPFILRRLKTEVAKELPPKTEIVRRVSLSDQQLDLYEAVRHVMNDKVREEIAAKGLARSHIVILDALLKLRQTCCDPRLVKLEAARKVHDSAKLEELMEMLPTLIEEGRRILLFSQFTSMLDLIKPELKKQSIDFVELRGTTKDRATPIARFQKGEVPLFLISLKAGGTGLNLTAADTVIHYDPWWNPAVENQATDRAHRIGQDKPVFVYKLIAKDTVEEKILELQERKAGLAAALFGDAPSAAARLTQDDVRWLMGE